MSDLLIRPHHALCLRFFAGEGYSEDFVRHMYDIIRMLEKNPTVTLTDGCDAICSACPHNRGGECKSDEKVRQIDRGVLRALELNDRESLAWGELYDRAFCRIVQAGRLPEICRGCEWIHLCNK